MKAMDRRQAFMDKKRSESGRLQSLRASTQSINELKDNSEDQEGLSDTIKSETVISDKSKVKDEKIAQKQEKAEKNG